MWHLTYNSYIVHVARYMLFKFIRFVFSSYMQADDHVYAEQRGPPPSVCPLAQK